MASTARAPLHNAQTIALIESNPLSSASWETLADRLRSENDPLSVKSLEVIIRGLKRLEEANSAAAKTRGASLSELSQSMFVRLARAYNSPTLLKEVGLIYLRDLNLPEVALDHFERALILGGPEKELRPLTEAAAVAVQRTLSKSRGEGPRLSGINAAHASPIAATTIIRKTGKLFAPAGLNEDSLEEDREIHVPSKDVRPEAGQPLPATTELCLAAAEQAADEGALARAETLLRKANEKPAASHAMWQGWTALGHAAYEARDYSRAESAFTEALRFQPQDLAAHFNAALGHQLNRHYPEALEAYHRADEMQPGNPKVGCNLGALYFQMEDFARAEETLRTAVLGNPTYARAWDNLAAALGAQDKLTDALEACQRAVALQIDYPEARFKMGVIHFTRQEWEPALAEFARAAKLSSLACYGEVFLAMIYARLGQLPAAETAARRAMEIDSKCDLLWMAWNELGLALSAQGDHPGATAAYRQATELKSEEPAAWFNLGVSCQRAGELAGAMQAYQRAIKINPELAEAWHNLGIIYAENGDLPLAATAFQHEASSEPGNVRAWHDLGVVSEKLGRHEEAREAFAKGGATSSAVEKTKSARLP